MGVVGPIHWKDSCSIWLSHSKSVYSMSRSKILPTQSYTFCTWANFVLVVLNLCHCRNPDNSRRAELYLGHFERTYFVNVVLKLIDRGQYSKNEHLSETVAAATSILSYVDPSSVLPFLETRFHIALETVSIVA